MPKPPVRSRRLLAVAATLLAGFATAAMPGEAAAPSEAAGAVAKGTAATDRTAAVAVAAVDAEGTIRLATPIAGSAALRLAGVRLPRPPEPLAAEAVRAAADLLIGHNVVIAAAAPLDRHRRHVAAPVRDDGLDITAELVRRGWARVDPRFLMGPTPPAGLPALFELEREARAAGRGLWANPAYAIRSVDSLSDHIHSFQLVEGVVLKAVAIGDRVYLNFGADYRTDFTVTIAGDDVGAFSAAGIDPLALTGRRLRVRGWVQWFNGPQIEATTPAQFELRGD